MKHETDKFAVGDMTIVKIKDYKILCLIDKQTNKTIAFWDMNIGWRRNVFSIIYTDQLKEEFTKSLETADIFFKNWEIKEIIE